MGCGENCPCPTPTFGLAQDLVAAADDIRIHPFNWLVIPEPAMSQPAAMPLGFYVVSLVIFAVIVLGFITRTEINESESSFSNLRRNCPHVSKTYPHYYSGCSIECTGNQQTRDANFAIVNKELYGLMRDARYTLAETGPLMSAPSPHLTLGYYCCLNRSDFDIINRVIKRFPWETTDLAVSLQPTAVCSVVGQEQASIYMDVSAEDNRKLLAIQTQIEDEILAEGVQLKLRRQDQEHFHITLATIQEAEYNMHRGLLHLNKWIASHPDRVDGFPMRLTTPCWQEHGRSLGVERRLRMLVVQSVFTA
jgi:2'-5' RNA ligase